MLSPDCFSMRVISSNTNLLKSSTRIGFPFNDPTLLEEFCPNISTTLAPPTKPPTAILAIKRIRIAHITTCIWVRIFVMIPIGVQFIEVSKRMQNYLDDIF